MVSDDKPEGERRRSHHRFIPAGIFIGLGVGFRVNYPGPGVLIGLGGGFPALERKRHACPTAVTRYPIRAPVTALVDLCPEDTAKIAPGTCECGVPETDTDSDGTPDCIDT
jgi:hypothetical protein